MRWMTMAFLCALTVLAGASSGLAAYSLEQAWTADVFMNNTDAAFNPADQNIYVTSEVSLGAGSTAGDGVISQIDKDGNVLSANWMGTEAGDGPLDNPKGILFDGGGIYVVEKGQMDQYDKDTLALLASYTVGGATKKNSLQDVVKGADGRIYCSYPNRDIIDVVVGDAFEQFSLEALGPGNMAAGAEGLYVAGENSIWTVSYADGSAAQIYQSDVPVYGIDGDGAGNFFFVDADSIRVLNADNSVEKLIDLPFTTEPTTGEGAGLPFATDLLYIDSLGLLIVHDSQAKVYAFTVSGGDEPGPGPDPEPEPVTPSAAEVLGWWWDPAEVGNGQAIETKLTRDNFIKMLWCTFDDAGAPVWYLSEPQTARDAQYLGELYTANAGAMEDVGEVDVTFTSGAAAGITYTVEGAGAAGKQVERFMSEALYPGELHPRGVSGFWVDPALINTGGFIECRGDSLYAAWYMTDENGDAIWYGFGGTPGNFPQAQNAITAPVIKYSGGNMIGAAPAGYITAEDMGQGTLTFNQDGSATFVFDGTTYNLQRDNF